MVDYDRDSETSPNEVKPRPRRHRRKRAPQNSHDYMQKEVDADVTISNPVAIANQAALSHSKSSVEYSTSRDNVSALPGNKSEKRMNHANRRLTKMSNTSEEVENNERSRPRRKVRSAQRIARSVSEEVLALEGRNEQNINQSAAEDSRVKTKNSTDEFSKTDPDTVNGERRHGRRTRPREHRKKRKPKATNYSSDNEENYQGDEEFSEVFPVDKEDIVQVSDITRSCTKTSGTHMMPPLPSQQSDVVYIEKKGGQGFVNEHKSKIIKAPERTIQLRDDRGEENTTLDFVLKIHLGFRSFSLIVQGLLAGFALSQCMFVYSLANQDDKALLKNYQDLALPYQSMYYFLLAICNVSIFDRYINISSGWSQLFSILIRKPSRALALICYLFALIFSVALAQLDDRISMYKSMPNLWEKNSTKHLTTWKIINLLRVIGSVLGWIMVALAPNDDLTAATIEEKISKEKCDEMSISNGRSSMQNSTSVVTWDRVNS